jgi:CDP-diacylglycerol--serine O-phosphatidyltransferase
MIIWCVLFDKLDGFAARILKASSDFGAQFDSLADLVAFGVAPGFLVYFYMQTLDYAWFASHRPLMMVSVSVYMLCASMRLARYNAMDSEELVNYFHGLPSTFAGGFIAISVILYSKYELAWKFPGFMAALPLLLILTGILMVSPLYLPKLVRREHKLFNLFQIANIVIGYSCGFGMVFPEYLYIVLLIYGVVGFSIGIARKGVILNTGSDPNSD